jgi:glycosyltransferase involved in cell wall biosynthesis
MIDLVIPVFNRLEYTETCLSSLLRNDPGAVLRPIVVDNGSRRRTRSYVEQWVKDAQSSTHLRDPIIVTHAQNLGFAAAVNSAIKHSSEGKYVFLMHNDCVPFEGWAGEMLECLKLHEPDDAIAVVPRTSYANEPVPCVPEVRQKFETMKFGNKDAVSVDDIAGLFSRLYPDGVRAIVDGLKAAPRTSYIPELCSYCVLLHKELLVQKPLDEDFWPRFFEDKFWFLHHERQGCVCMIANHAYVHHFGNITSDGPGFAMPDLFKANELKFKEKVRILNENSVPKREK